MLRAMLRRRPAWILLALVLAGCSREAEDAPKPSGERTREPVPETPKDAPSGPFAKFDFEAAARRWQGAWVLPGEAVGGQVAWNVVGDRVTSSSTASEASLRFAVYSPCQIGYTDDAAGETTYLNFVFVGEALHAGFGATGVVLGDTIIVCDGDGQVYALTGEQCSRWSEMFDDWKSEPARCRVEGEGEARTFVVGESRLSFVGDALLEATMREQVASWHADFAAAKSALASGAAVPSVP